MCKYAYLSDKKIKTKYKKKLVGIYRLNETDGLAFILKDTKEEVITVAIRGSANIKNWIVDAEYRKEYDEKAKVWLHRGFKKASRELLDTIRPVLDKYNGLGYRIDVTGHSLGGAMAVILGMYLEVYYYTQRRIVTFGQPKVTNRKGVKAYRNLNILRIVDEKDPVPLVPPITFLSFVHGLYRHMGMETILLKEKYVVEMGVTQSEGFCVSSLWGNIKDIDVKDHEMDHYLDRIKPKTKGFINVPYADRKKYEDD